MNWAYLVAVFLVMWWTILFAVLPLGVKSQAESGEVVEGTDPGAPVRPMMLKKIVITTILTAFVFSAFVLWTSYA
jgi:predicted secreted protein